MTVANEAVATETKRIIGIRHRIKQTAKGEAHPTQVVIRDEDSVRWVDLPDEQAELDFLQGIFPLRMREITEDDDLEALPKHHVKSRGKEENEKTMVPAKYEGLKSGDTVAMILGGSGDYFAYALSRKSEEIGSQVIRIPPFTFKKLRGDDGDKKDDAALLAQLAEDRPEIFTPIDPRDAKLILVRMTWRALQDTMKARIGCGQRLQQRVIGKIFCSPEGGFPEGNIKNVHKETESNDTTFNALENEEKARERELVNALNALDIYQELFLPIEGVGPRIAGRIIATIIDIRRFETSAQLKAYAGHHLGPNGEFMRKRTGQVSNWQGELRQAMVLFGDQCSRRKDSKWGKEYRKVKVNLRKIHPEPIMVDNKKRYTDGHIHKMALWRTQTMFLVWLFHKWYEILRNSKQPIHILEDQAA